MDIEKRVKELNIIEDQKVLREKNLRTVLAFMTDEEDAETGKQKEKRLNRYKLYTKEGQGYRYGAGYTYKGEERLKERDETTVRRFPIWYTKNLEIFQTSDPNVILAVGYAMGNQYDDDGNFMMDIPPSDPCHNMFIMEDGKIKEYIEYILPAMQFPHDKSDIEELIKSGKTDQII